MFLDIFELPRLFKPFLNIGSFAMIRYGRHQQLDHASGIYIMGLIRVVLIPDCMAIVHFRECFLKSKLILPRAVIHLFSSASILSSTTRHDVSCPAKPMASSRIQHAPSLETFLLRAKK